MDNQYRKRYNLDPIDEGRIIEVSMHYELGGMNPFNMTRSARGYYIHVTPVEIRGGIKSSVLLGDMWESGFKHLVLPCERRSKNREATAWGVIEPLTEDVANAFYAQDKDRITELLLQPATV